MGKVEFVTPTPSPSDPTADYHVGIEIDGHAHTQSAASSVPKPPGSGHLRRVQTFNAATEEEQRNIISLRYRADSMADSVEEDNDSTEAKIWHVFEQVFCFLKGMTIYQSRRRLQFIMVSQAAINTIRIIPIILGLSYQATVPVLILYITLILGWHGTKFLVPKFLLLYKIGMQLSLLVDVIWYIKGYNGKLSTSVSSGTSVLMQGFFSVLLTLLNVAGLLYGWKLRRIVKAVQDQRECDRAALATMIPPTPPPRHGSIHQLRQTLSINPIVDVEENRNLVRTSKYTFYNFPFVFLKMQFSRLANFYTTIVVMLCFFSFSPVSPVASLTPLLIVFATSALKDVSEDMRRQKSDRLVNSKPAHIVRRDTNDQIVHVDGMWQDIQVGDLLILKDGDEVPADCILLATSRPDGRCYVETANLDGETNLKIRSVAKSTKHFLTADSILEKHRLHVECDSPNKDLFYFDGVLKLLSHDQDDQTTAGSRDDETDTSLTMDNLILRGSESRNSEWTIGLVIYTGRETKIFMNSSAVPLKRSFVEKTLDTMFVLVLIMLFSISVACTLGNNNWAFDLDDATAPWYIGRSGDNGYIFLSYVILFNNLIPLSMYVTMEGVRFVHARYIENDLEMYDEPSDSPAQVRNSNINEDLGQIQYIFSDKTGTLTRNEMIFAKCTIAGLRYNDMETDTNRPPRPGTRFNDSRLLTRLNSNHSTKADIHNFLLLLTICNTVIPDYDRGHGDKTFEPKSDVAGLADEFLSEDLEYAMVIDGKTLALVLEDDIKYLFLAVATQSNVGVGISGKEGRQAVLSSDYALAQFRFLKRLLLVHGNYSYKRISKLILFSFMKNVALSLSNFFLAVQTMYSGLLMYFGIYFTLYNALFTTIPIVFIAMYNQDVSPAVLMQYPTLYVNGLKNRSFNWISFFGWCGLGIWHAYVIFAVPFFSNGFIVWYFANDSKDQYLFGANDLGMWAVGVAAYTYLITASTAQVSLMTSNWTRANVVSTIGTLIFYFVFLAFFCALYGWTKTELYETEVAYGVLQKLVTQAWFWFGLLLATVGAALPNYIAKAGRVLFYPEPSHLMREWNRLSKGDEAPTVMESPRLVRRNTGFAFSHCPGESEMALSQFRNLSQVSSSQLAGSHGFRSTMQQSTSPTSTEDVSTQSTTRS
ncbi:hypothetical protein ATCC90586_010272 [Pythium insidiosum]|nr:hypothetical protein ATCC90586_010272 [Pythium insidiosum]